MNNKEVKCATTDSVMGEESPQFDQPVEWWFAHGHYTANGFTRRSFMVSFFRQHMPDQKGRDVHYTLQTFFDEDTGKFKSNMFIHKDTWDFMVCYRPDQENHDIDPFLVNLCLDELRDYGPTAPIVISESKVTVKADPLTYHWEDFRLKQNSDNFELGFFDPFSQEFCTVFLKPQGPRLDLNTLGVTSFCNMAYFCYPRMNLYGRLGNVQVQGRGWFDHQVGEYRDTFLTHL